MTRSNTPEERNNGSSPAWHFGRQVRKARIARGWTIRDLARETGITGGHLSRIENGRAAPTERVAIAMDRVFPDRHGWFSEYQRDSQEWAPPGYRSLGPYENAAANLRVWCPGTLHGLVQTEDYARALLATFPGATPDLINTRVKARMERRKRVLHRDNPPAVWFLVDETALFRQVGSPEVMAAALEDLLAVAALPHVTVQVVPTMAHGATASEIIVMDNAAYAEHVWQGFTYTDEDTVTALGRVITTLQGEGYRVSESTQLIEGMRDIWSRGENPLTALLTAVRA